MKIFLDDKREFPKEGYECARTYEQCRLFISVYRDKLKTVNLDYDLGERKTGLDVLEYMKENNINPQVIIVHSTHPEGVSLMREYIKENFRDSTYLHRPL